MNMISSTVEKDQGKKIMKTEDGISILCLIQNKM